MISKWLIEASVVTMVGITTASAADRGSALLDAARAGDAQAVRALVTQKLTSVRGKIEELRKLEKSLGSALRKCNRSLRKNPTDDECCPVLDELGSTSGHRGN